jgi:hypothetical protein
VAGLAGEFVAPDLEYSAVDLVGADMSAAEKGDEWVAED